MATRSTYRAQWANCLCCRPCAKLPVTPSSSPTARPAGIRSTTALAARRCTSRACWRWRCRQTPVVLRELRSPMALPLFPTSLVGSYAQPEWLIDREKLAGRFPPRVRARELWRIESEFLDEAQDDATRIAILDQERAGLDIVTDGEMRRESYSNRFATALENTDIDNQGTAL